MATIHFLETQKFKQWWLWLLLASVTLIPIGVFVTENQMQQTQNGGILALAFTLVIMIAVIAFVLIIKLCVEIDEQLISYQLYPFHFSKQKIYWTDVDYAFVRQYKPILEYGGWGLRYSLRNGKAYNISGKIGLQLQLKNGKKILLGTQKQNELEEVMQTLYQLKIVAKN